MISRDQSVDRKAMAQDVRDSTVQDSDPGLEKRALEEEKPLPAEYLSAQPDQLRDRSNDDSRSIEPFYNHDNSENGVLSPSLRAMREPESLNVEDGGSGQTFGYKPRTLPAWIRSVEYPEDECEAGVTSRLLPSQPDDAIIAQHNHSPYTASRPHYDYSGQIESLEGGHGNEPPRESRWQTFSRSIAYPRTQDVEQQLVTPDWLNENHGDYSEPWRGKLEDDENTEDPLKKKRRRQIWFKRFHNTLLESPIVPLIIRLTVWCFSLIALALGGSIQHLSDDFSHPQGPSALMAIIVDAVALVYLVYITWDEYTAKPLGLRSASAKARLILLDIFFIVFDSANLSLAFESLSTVQGSCTVAEVNQEITPKNDTICNRQKALASVLLIALIAWLTTFSISVLRLVRRVAP